MITQSNKLTKEMIEYGEDSGVIDDIYGQEVNRLIRLRYSQSAENSIYRHKFNGTGDEEFLVFNNYCEECKIKARETINNLKNPGRT